MTRYNACGIPLRLGDHCIVETDHGIEVGRVATNPMILPPEHVRGKLPKILRRATDKDIARFKELEEEEMEARRMAQRFIRSMGLTMKIFQVEYHFEEDLATFYFTAQERVPIGPEAVQRVGDASGNETDRRPG